MGLLSGVLPKVYSASDTLKRKVGGLLSDPVGTLQQHVGLLNDNARSFNQLHSKATQESVNSIKVGGSGFGPASQQLAGKLADAYNPVGMINWPGAPSVVYHGTGKDFAKFDRSKLTSNTNANDASIGWHFSDNKSDAGFYADMAARKAGQEKGFIGKWDVDMKNPLVIGIDEADGNVPQDLIEGLLNDKFLAKEYAIKNGHDGIIYPYGTNVDSAWTAILFDGDKAKQIK